MHGTATAMLPASASAAIMSAPRPRDRRSRADLRRKTIVRAHIAQLVDHEPKLRGRRDARHAEMRVEQDAIRVAVERGAGGAKDATLRVKGGDAASSIAR